MMRLSLHPRTYLSWRSRGGGCSVGASPGPRHFFTARLHLCIRRLCSNPLDTDTVKGGALYPSPPLYFHPPLSLSRAPSLSLAPSLSSPYPPRGLCALRRARRSEVREPPWPPVTRTALSRHPALGCPSEGRSPSACCWNTALFYNEEKAETWCCWRGARGAGFPFCVFMDWCASVTRAALRT